MIKKILLISFSLAMIFCVSPAIHADESAAVQPASAESASAELTSAEPVSAVSASAESTSIAPFDLQQIEEQIDTYGIPTTSKVQELKNKAFQLIEAKDWKNAVVALDLWARHANTLANLITTALEPFYSASSANRSELAPAKVSLLRIYEDLSNQYKRDRNHAMIMLAECYINLGEMEKATMYLKQVLNVISIDEWDLWKIALKDLYLILEVDTTIIP